MHPSCLSEEALLKECDLRNDRRSGPGGQHRNKVETAVIITHRPSGCMAEGNERRRQTDNRRVALFRLRLHLALAVRSPEPAVAPSELWRSRVKNHRLAVAAEHEDFPALLAEMLDQLEIQDNDLAAAATYFAVTPSQLVKFLKQFPPALQKVNAIRVERGMHKLS